jgi:hypothetical protein
MAPPRVLLLTGTLPSEGGVGGLILRDLVRLYPRGRMSCLALLSGTAARVRADPDWLPRQAIVLPRSFNADWRRGLVGRALTHARFQLSRRVHEPKLIRQAGAFGRTHRVELLWAVLDQPVLYRVAPAVADLLNLPLIATVWDPPDSVCINANLDRASAAMAVYDFQRALGRASRCAVMTEAMQQDYERRHGLQTIIMRHAVRAEECVTPARRPNSHTPLTIGFCGSLYAAREFRALLAALDEAQWQVASRSVRLRVMTAALSGAIGPRASIEWLGWRPEDETIRILAESDVNYLPYWFDERRRNAVRLCFPSKLTTYLAAGRPVLYHGPAEAGAAEFMRRHPIGVCCHSASGADLIAAMTYIVEKKDAYRRAAIAIEAVREHEFSAAKLPARFAALLGIPEASLTSTSAARTRSEPAGVP